MLRKLTCFDLVGSFLALVVGAGKMKGVASAGMLLGTSLSLNRTICSLLFAVAGIIALGTPSRADEYVDGYYGVDGAPNDGSSEYPWSTIQYAINQATDGETIYVMPVTYYEHVVIDGREDLTLKVWPGQSGKPVVTGNGVLPTTMDPVIGTPKVSRGLIDIIDSEDIVIDGFKVTGSNYAGVRIKNAHASQRVSKRNYIKNCIVFDCDTHGIVARGDPSLGEPECGPYATYILDNEIYDVCTAQAGGEALSIIACNNFTVSGNEIHDDYKEGIDIKIGSELGIVTENNIYDAKANPTSPYAPGIYVDARGTVDYVYVYDNTITERRGGIVLATETSPGAIKSTYIYDNLVYDIHSNIGADRQAFNIATQYDEEENAHSVELDGVYVYNNWFQANTIVFRLNLPTTKVTEFEFTSNLLFDGWVPADPDPANSRQFIHLQDGVDPEEDVWVEAAYNALVTNGNLLIDDNGFSAAVDTSEGYEWMHGD